ncbi:MAG TPA: ABC transporter ATP-binding protein, partial [Chthonomonadaceae bacterium]|nr:ABC transporter ATP-binding protein [Chthonomonadaceae bacterium]
MQNFVRFVKEIRPYWRLMALIVLLTLFNSALSLPPPRILGYLTDQFMQGKTPNLPGVFAAFAGIALASAFFGYYLTYTITLLGQKFKYDMRGKLYAHMQTLSLGFFEKSQTGKLMSNITNDVASLDQLIGGGFVTVIQDCATLFAVLAFIFTVNWKLSLIALAVYPLYIFNYLAFIGRIKLTSHEVREQREVLYGDLQEKLAGVQVVKSYAKERYEVRQFVGETRNLLGLNVRMTSLSTGLWTVAEFIGSGCGMGLLLWYGSRLVMQGQLSPG